ncbi:MAG: hypothetical protein CL881_06440 [Dehalococcoidia bacterium]|jgi:hypothetical protein|nr:hypothetical protein [Dehalococcoidia bacterium]|tara:strand:+ start:682 stop:864 length:183 start_codon:yes stop_codon:yes gene_type:complete
MLPDQVKKYLKWKDCIKKSNGVRSLLGLTADEISDFKVCKIEFLEYKKACIKALESKFKN